MSQLPHGPTGPLPYKIATLCDLRDADGRVLLLKRLKEPNFGMHSPIGGKLEMATGESPSHAAQREIHEEAGIHVELERLHLLGLISETAYEGRVHWLIFYFRVLGPVNAQARSMNEGQLDWFAMGDLDKLALPDSDREIIWPMVHKHEADYLAGRAERPGFFNIHIDCTKDSGRRMDITVLQG